MNNYIYPLPKAKAGGKYIIKQILDEKSKSGELNGYGLFPGSEIRPLFPSPSGNPFAYEIMGTVLALRHEDANKILVSRE